MTNIDHNALARRIAMPHCTISDIGIEAVSEDGQPLVDHINEYLHQFASTGGKCPKCDAKLGGLLGSFTWGLCHGEGICTGGFSGKCGWPCRALHRIKNLEGEEIFDRSLQPILPYHPEFVTQEPIEEDDES